MTRALIFSVILALGATSVQAQVDADEVNRQLQGNQSAQDQDKRNGAIHLQGGQGNQPVQDQDKRNGTIHLQGGQGNQPVQDKDKRNGTIHLQGGQGNAAHGVQAKVFDAHWPPGAVVPTSAMVSFELATPAAVLYAALAADVASMSRLIARLAEAGVAAGQVNTLSLTVEGGSTPGKAYTLVRQVTIEVRDLARIDAVLAQLDGAAVTSIVFGNAEAPH